MKKITFISILILLSVFTFSQNKITGIVYDVQTNEGLPGVNIVIEGKTVGATSNYNGNFTIECNEKIKVLLFSFTGYETKKVEVKSANLIVKLEPTSIELDRIVVTANRDSRDRREVPAALTSMGSKQIEEIQATTVPDILNKVTGIHIADFGNEQQSMSIRMPLSFSRTQLVILEDGIPIGPTSISTSGNLKDINMSAVKNIEVIRGPASSLYGSEAVGGAVNFITKNPTPFLTADVSLQASDQGYKRGDFHIGKRFGKFGFTLSGYSAQKRNGYRENSDFDKTIISMKSDYLFSANSKLTFSLTYSEFYTDFSSSLDSAQFYEDPTINYHTFTYDDNSLLRTSLRFDHNWNKKSKTFITGFYRDYQNEDLPSYLIRTVRIPQPGPPKFVYRGELINSSYKSYGFIAQHFQEFDFLNSKLIFGVTHDHTPDSYYSERIDATKDTNGYYKDYEKLNEEVQNFDATLNKSAAYLNYQFSPVKDLNIVTAIRYDRLDYVYDNHLDSAGYTSAPDESNSFDHISPKLGFTYQINKSLSAYTNFSVGFSPPLFSQLYKEVVIPVLKPATFYNYEVGGWYNSINGKIYADIALFQIDGKNEVVSVMQFDGSEQNQSVGETLHRGLELSTRVKILKDFEWRLSTILSNHEFVDFATTDSTNYNGNKMTQAPGLITNTGLTYKPSFLPKFRIGLEWQHIGEYWMDELNTEKYNGYSLLNMRLGYKYKNIGAWVNILNLTDELFAARASKSYYGPIISRSYSVGYPRTIFFGLSYSFKSKKSEN